MATKDKQRNDLDRSIDLGMDQFGRFLKTRWLLVVIILLVIWYIVAFALPGFQIPNAGTIVYYAFQIVFALSFVVIQFVALFWFLARPRLYWVMPGETGVTFDDYKGNPEVLESARRIVTLIRGDEEFQKLGGQPVRGLLLTGDPGTGKSYLAQCMSSEAGVPFGYCSAASLRNMFLGIDVLIMINIYRKARRFARDYGGCIVFMDEIDAIAQSRGSGPQGMGAGMGGGGMLGGLMGGGMGSLNQLLMEMDPPNIETGWFKKLLRLVGLYHGRTQRQPVLTVGATNIPESLDRALLRPGRFDRRVEVAPPTDKYRPEVIEYYLSKVKHEPDISVAALSARLVNYTPVAIKHVVNEAVIIAHFDGRESITYRDLIEAQDVHEYGLRQISELPAIERRRLAYHEAGHTVASYYLQERYFPSYVTVHMRSGDDLKGAAAFAHRRPKETVITQSREEVLASIQICLASRATEELFLNTQLNGVAGDFMQATTLAANYIGIYGMDGTLASYAPVGDPTKLPGISERVEKLLQSQMKAVKQLLQEHSEALIAVAEALVEHDELVADDIKRLIDEADAHQVAKQIMSDFQPLLTSGSNGHSNGDGTQPRVIDTTIQGD
jgi:cell division protease FtsH